MGKSKWAENFNSKEIQIALKSVKTGKAAGLNGIHPEFLKNYSPNTRKYLSEFFSTYYARVNYQNYSKQLRY